MSGLNHLVLVVTLFLAGMVLTSCNKAKEVEAVFPQKGKISQSFTEPARTRLENVYRITVPVDGRIERLEWDPGEKVSKGQLLVAYDLVPLEQTVAEAKAAVLELEASLNVLDDASLENTAMEEANAVVEASQEALNAADKQVEAEKALSDHAQKRLDEHEALFEGNAVSQQVLDDVKLSAETALISLREREFDRSSLKAMMTAVKTGPKFVLAWLKREGLQRIEVENKLAQAKARLVFAEHQLKLAREVYSPIDGIVLERLDDGDRALSAGQPVLLIGNLDELEVVADVLTQDAMKLSVGSTVELRPTEAETTIQGAVKRINPQGFTKLSSLGVEQQRVNIIIALDQQPANLGVGYRLQARFITGEKNTALIIPRFSVLQDINGGFYVYKIEQNHLVKTPVEIGLKSDLEMEITKGLNLQDRIVSTPDTTMQPGDKVVVLK